MISFDRDVTIHWTIILTPRQCYYIDRKVAMTIVSAIIFKPSSRGTKVEKMLTLAPERYTAGLCMVAKVILWCILNHCIADSIDLHYVRAVNQHEHVKI